MVERLMNELAAMWIDALGRSTKVKSKIREDFENICPGVTWLWVKDERGHLVKIKVTGFKKPPEDQQVEGKRVKPKFKRPMKPKVIPGTYILSSS